MSKDIVFSDIGRLLPPRPDHAHKGTMGILCSLCGSYGYSGAAILSAKAALRSGIGLHCQILPECIYPIFASSVFESVCVPVKGAYVGTFSHEDLPAIRNTVKRADAILIGCGMGNTSDTQAVTKAVLTEAKVPVVVDADGINALAQHIDILESCQKDVVLTPHIGEFARLSGLSTAYISEHQEQVAALFSTSHPDLVLVLKSHRTVIAKNGALYRSTAGNSGMATGGSGDVLAGIIAALIAEGAAPLDAAVAGVAVHAAAGDIAAKKLGKTAMLPSDIIDCLHEVYQKAET